MSHIYRGLCLDSGPRLDRWKSVQGSGTIQGFIEDIMDEYIEKSADILDTHCQNGSVYDITLFMSAKSSEIGFSSE